MIWIQLSPAKKSSCCIRMYTVAFVSDAFPVYGAFKNTVYDNINIILTKSVK